MKIYIQKYIEKHVQRILMDLFLQLDKQINCKENNREYIMTSKCYRIIQHSEIVTVLYLYLCNNNVHQEARKILYNITREKTKQKLRVHKVCSKTTDLRK